MSLEVKVDYEDCVKFGVTARSHHIVCDQPPENGGADAGMTPPELMLAALGTCVAYYAVEYLRARHLQTEGLAIHVSAEKVLKPARLDGFKIVVEAPGIGDERHREGLLRAAKGCLIHNTLLHAPRVDVEIQNLGTTVEGVQPAARH
jgi:uncharacterized OsmC-like protein